MRRGAILAVVLVLWPSASPLAGQVPEWAEEARARLASRAPLAVQGLAAESMRVPRLSRFELSFRLGGTYDNPFDPEQIDVRVQFTTRSGTQHEIPAFFCEDGMRPPSPDTQEERAGWKARYAPVETGTHSYRIVARDSAGAEAEAGGYFECITGAGRGFVGVRPENPRYLAFADGETWFPIGINLFQFANLRRPIPDDRAAVCNARLTALAENGANFARLRADSWWLAVELPASEPAGFLGPGYYHQRTCRDIDSILAHAERAEIGLMFCAYNANANVNGPRELWRRPFDLFSRENGGPCAEADEFWTDAEAGRLVRNKLRYVTARWGYSPAVVGWEFFNEVSVDKSDPGDVAAWHAEMARYWKELDIYGRPVTTSLMGDQDKKARIWSLPEIDIVQQHIYNATDIAAAHAAAAREAAAHYRKPFLIAEYGGSVRGGMERDVDGVNLHNGLWASPFAGACGAGAYWFVESYLEPNDLWRQYAPLAEFLRGVRWPSASWDVEAAAPRFADPADAAGLEVDVPLPSGSYTFDIPPVTEFEVTVNGAAENAHMVRPYLHCIKARKAPPTFVFNFPRRVRFEVRVTESTGDETNALVLKLDGREVRRVLLPAGPELGIRSVPIPQWNNWRTTYDEVVSVEVPPGRHAVTAEAVGRDRLQVEYLVRGVPATADYEPVRVLAFADGRSAYAWFQDRRSTWGSTGHGTPDTLPRLRTELRGLPDGEYRIEWVDTWGRRPPVRQEGRCGAGLLPLSLPPFSRDIACRIGRADGSPLR